MSTCVFRSFYSRLLALCIASGWFASLALADVVWHCSRTDMQVAAAGDNFTLAALDAEREVMRISLRDLYAVYQGTPVTVSGLPVSACFVGGDDATTRAALQSIGAQPKVLAQLSRKHALVSSPLFMVQSEQEMLACMAKHHPAIGYLAKPTHTEAVGPCF